MKNKNCLLVFHFTILFLFLLNSCKNNTSEDEKYIIDGETKWAESVATNDASILEKILADDFVWILDGKKMTKKMAVDDAKAGPGDFISDHLNKANVRFFGNTAVVDGAETWTRKHTDGITFQGQFIWTDTWIKLNGVWQIVQAEDITVPFEKNK